MWLLDANLDVNLIPVLREFGIASDSAILRGWRELVNGDLVAAAIEHGFTCLLTRDRRFVQSAVRELKAHPGFSIVIIRMAQRPSTVLLDDFRISWKMNPILPIEGSVVEWPS